MADVDCKCVYCGTKMKWATDMEYKAQGNRGIVAILWCPECKTEVVMRFVKGGYKVDGN